MLRRIGIASALVGAAALAAPLTAQSVEAPRADASIAVGASTASDADEERERAFLALDREFTAHWSRYQEARARVKSGELAAADAPPPPQAQFYGRYAALAQAQHPRALRWCIQFAASSGLEAAAVAATRRANYRTLVERYADEPWIGEVLRELRHDAKQGHVTVDEAVAWCLVARDSASASQAAALATLEAALILAASADAAQASRAKELFGAILAQHPDSSVAERARGKLYQLERLQVGMPVPDVTAQDVDGVPVRLRDLRGRVVVLDFWGFW